MKYRETIYNNYFSNHLGRGLDDVKTAIEQQFRHLKPEFAHLLPSNKSIKVLEVGCGYGPFLYTLEKLGYQNTEGVDLSEEQVRVAHSLGMTQIKCAPLAEILSSNENSYDLIVGIDILEHLTKNELVESLSLIKSALKTGGHGIFRIPNMDAPYASVYANADISHEMYFNKSSAIQLFGAMGFSKTTVHSSLIRNQSTWKELIRKVLWSLTKFKMKLTLFASGRTWDDVVFTPNLIVKATK